MDRCDDLREYLAAYADGELLVPSDPEGDAGMRERVRTHLEACPECRRELAALERVDALFRAAAVPEVAPRDWEKVSAALDDVLRARPASIDTLRERAGRRGALVTWLLPAAAVVAAAVIVAVFLMGPAPTPAPPGIEITDLEVGADYEAGVTLPSKDNDFLIIDVTNVE